MRPTVTAVLTLTIIGCAPQRPASPVELDELSHALFRDWEDPVATQGHTDQLAGWLEAEADTDVGWEGQRLTNLTHGDVTSVDFPADTDLTAHGGMATTLASTFPIHSHAQLLVEADQTFTEPATFLQYDRQVVAGDAELFGEGEGLVRTDNTIRKSGPFGIEIPYTLRKDYRWVHSGDVSAVVGRGWVTEAGCSDNEKNCVLQSWGVDVFVQSGDQTLRLYEVWIEVKTEADAFLTDEQKLNLVAKGNQDLLEATEEELGSR